MLSELYYKLNNKVLKNIEFFLQEPYNILFASAAKHSVGSFSKQILVLSFNQPYIIYI